MLSRLRPDVHEGRSIRVLQVTSVYYPELRYGGPPMKIHLLSRGLREAGFSVNVITFHSKQPSCTDRTNFDGIPVQYVPWIGRGFKQWPLRQELLTAAIRQADIIHCYGLYNALCPIAAWHAKNLRKPYLLEPLGMYRPQVRNILAKKLYHRLFTSWMARHASGIVASSCAEQSDLDGLRRDGTTLVVRGNGIDLVPFRCLPSPESFRTKYRLDPKNRIILYLGRISPIKNLEQLIRAFRVAGCSDSVLLLAGPSLEPEYEAKIRALIKSLHFEELVRLIGPLYDQDKLAAFAAADLFVLPSLSESFGNAAAEAVAAGVPVLLTNTCGIAPMIHGRAGLAVPLGEVSIANGLRIMMSQERSQYLRQRDQVPQELTCHGPVQQTANLYESVLTREKV
jgi:glycosyltransferase involved in cell wall biosynthesis